MLKAADIAAEVRVVLANANRGKGPAPHFLTAYQVLNRLPEAVRDQLIAERGMPGARAGVYNAAANVVKDAMQHHLRAEVEISYLDNVGIGFDVAGTQIQGGYPVCGLYRLTREDESEP